MRVEDGPPFIDGILCRIIEADVATVPVDAMGEAHIESHEDGLGGAELEREVKGLTAAIRNPSDFAEFLKEELFDMGAALNPLKAKFFRRFRVLRDF